MKITAFLGSPRKKGNTEALVEAAMEGAVAHGAEISLFRLGELQIQPCKNCGGCQETGRCVIDDAMGPIYEAIRGSDRFILASPIFFFALSAQTKAMIDRCQAFWCERYLLKRPIPPGPAGRSGLLLLVGAYKGNDKAVECADVCATAFFHSISVGSHERLAYLGIEEAGAIRRHPSALAEARAAGARLATESPGGS